MRAYTLLFALALTACGGATAMPPAQPGALTGAVGRAPEATNAASEYGSLWVAWGPTAVEFDVRGAVSRRHARGAVKELGRIMPDSSGGVDHQIADAAVGSDGTYYALVDTWTYPSTGTAPTWELKIYAPGAKNADAYEQIITGTGFGVAVALDNDVIDVLAEDDFGVDHGYLAAYRYASGNRPAPVRTVTFPFAPGYLALDRRGSMYVSSVHGIFVYPAQMSGTPTAPLRTITLPPGAGPAFALGPKGDLWTFKTPGLSFDSAIYGFAAGNNGPTADVTIRLAGNIGRGIAVDQNDTVYVAVDGGIGMWPQASGVGSAFFSPPPATAAAPLGPPTAVTVGPPVRAACATSCRQPRSDESSTR